MRSSLRRIAYRFLRTKSVQGYSQMQKTFYRDAVKTVEDAYRVVHPDYDFARRQSRPYLAYMMNDFAERRVENLAGQTVEAMRNSFATPPDMKILDFGCGVGRNMEELVIGGYRVDGVDISAEMIDFAKRNPILRDCNFYLTEGNDCGNAPLGFYDCVYSCLCLQHICVRTIRLQILRAIREVLTEDGVIHTQFHYYPDITANEIPANHAAWHEDKVNVWGTNSEADVWITRDQLHRVIEDFGKFFHDIRLQFVEFPQDAYLFTEKYQHKFGHVIVSGSKNLSLAARMYKAIELP